MKYYDLYFLIGNIYLATLFIPDDIFKRIALMILGSLYLIVSLLAQGRYIKYLNRIRYLERKSKFEELMLNSKKKKRR